MSRGVQGLPPGLLAGSCRPRTSTQPPRAPLPALVKPAATAPTWQPISRVPGTSGLLQNDCDRDRIHGMQGVYGRRTSMPRATSAYGAMTGRQRHGGPVRRHAVMSGERAKTAAGPPLRLEFQGEAYRLPSTESQTIGTTRFLYPDLVDRHPTSPNQTQPVSGCQRLGSCEPTRSTGMSARHVESAMILAGSQRSA